MEDFTKKKIEKVDLFYLDQSDEKNPKPVYFEVWLGKSTMNARAKILDLAEQQQIKVEAIHSKYPELEISGDLMVSELTQAQQTLWYKKRSELKWNEYHYNIEYFKAIYSSKGLTAHQSEFLKENSKAEFWKMQDMTQIEEAVVFFRISSQV